MKAEKLHQPFITTANDLRELVKRCGETAGQGNDIEGHQFLAYLLDMARIEATTLLRSSS